MGLFPRHPASPETVAGAGDDLALAGTALLDVTREAADLTLPAVDNVLGLLVRPLQLLADPLVRQGAEIREAAGFGASVLNRWSGELVLFNATVDRLNREWDEAAGSSFGVAEPEAEPGQDAATRRAAVEAHDLQVADARAVLRADLRRQHREAEEQLDDTGVDLAAMLGRGPNEADWKTLDESGAVPVDFGGEDPGEPGGSPFVIGPPTRPDLTWDEDFVYDSADPTLADYRARLEWMAKLRGGQLFRSDLDDATQMYAHYWDNDGEPIEFDYEEAYNEDSGVRATIDEEIARAQQGAEALVAGGNTDFSMTGDASVSSTYPTTENWQKTIGGHQVWSSADVRVDGDQVTMTVVVHGEDHYNFNAGQADIGTAAPDDENGRFTELGWARPFDSSGTVTRTVTWTLGEAGSTTDGDGGPGDPDRNPGREDREDERDSGDPDRPTVPDNDRDTGPWRGQ